ncbi:choice-of-anchor A family protein [Floccifex sp.]|uniref:choice-of-anchor A family protein n=1 Tax=Floccifex sp. TaxID=2815810 RepID=UPI002A7498C5|nr:collagen-binding domain-containing protein [Floccifex sp.]MDD7280779.1 choice-of-anchor A family protein [Erysipelotrichaceae bacterium]MDY2959084.1 collagen-binding domain-containing protein [Floccifex sp.]
MKNVLKEMEKRKKRKKIWKKIGMVSSCGVVVATTIALMVPASTLESQAYCGMEEHTHNEDCFETILCCEKQEHQHNEDCIEITQVLNCDQDHEHSEDCFIIQENYICSQEEHIHDNTCYEERLICGQEEHVHEGMCYSNPYADLETSADWESTLKNIELTNNEATDLIAIAQSQLGYTESENNFIIDETGRYKGVTRYGTWYGDAYGDWCAMFVSFCLNYANIDFPKEANCQKWIEQLTEKNLYKEENPKIGDIIFFDNNQDDISDHVGIVYNIEDDFIETIEGNSDDRVQYVKYEKEDERIKGFGILPEHKEEIQVTIYSDASYESELDTTNQITIKGNFQPETQAKAYPVSLELEDEDVVCAYHIDVDDEQSIDEVYITLDGNQQQAQAIINDKTKTEQQEVIYALIQERSTILAGKYGNKTFAINTQKNAFTNDSTYANYYNDNSPLGVAGSFHIVAFNEARLGAHTNGNVLANKLYANSNFGTNNYEHELSYVQSYVNINSTSASKENHILVVGSDNVMGLVDNNNALSVNGTKIDKPYTIIQDEDSTTNPFIDLYQVEAEINSLSTRLSNMEAGKVTANLSDMNNRSFVLTEANSVGVYNMTAEELNNLSSNPLKMMGFKSNCQGAIVINVDCTNVSSVTLPSEAAIYIDGIQQSINETIDFTAGKVIWNFVNAAGKTISTNRMTGMVIAPGATVNIQQNLNGTVVAENVNVNAESHRTDFTGTIVDIPTSNNGIGFGVIAVDKNNYSNTLPGATFSLKKYDPTTNSYTEVGKYVSNNDGVVEITNNIEWNIAYELDEVTSPTGYDENDTVYEFVFEDGTGTSKKPEGFTGETHKQSHIQYVPHTKDGPEEDDDDYSLPETGGIGNGVIYGLGVSLVSMTSAILYRRKRNEN